MNTILSYPNRGKWGNPKYRGNCSGHVIRDLLQHFKPQKFVEVFSGGGTGQEVAKDLNIHNSVHLDLNNGWNALVDEIPTGSDFVFSHPPYWDMISYGDINKPHEDDLSNNMSYEDFIQKMNHVNLKIYNSLVQGGRHAMLIGDIKRDGEYFSPVHDLARIGDMDVYMIKSQHNTMSDKRKYSSNLIRIKHEHLLIMKKKQIWTVPITHTVTKEYDLRNFTTMTWRDLVQGALQELGGQADLQAIYQALESSSKAKKNQHWKAKIRQTLQINKNFQVVQRGTWELSLVA